MSRIVGLEMASQAQQIVPKLVVEMGLVDLSAATIGRKGLSREKRTES